MAQTTPDALFGPFFVCVGLRWPSLATQWLLWAFVGLRWPSLAVVGYCGFSWACIGLCWPLLAAVGLHGPALAFIDLCWPSLAVVGIKKITHLVMAQTTCLASFKPFFSLAAHPNPLRRFNP